MLFDYKYEVGMYLGDAAEFAQYDPFLNTLKVYGDRMKEMHVGDHMIEIEARIYNETYTVTQKEFFILTVWQPEKVVEPVYNLATCQSTSGL